MMTSYGPGDSHLSMANYVNQIVSSAKTPNKSNPIPPKKVTKKRHKKKKQ